MGNLEQAIKYPFAEARWESKFLLGGVLSILGSGLGFIPYVGFIFWILVSFLVLGYAYKIFRDHLRGEDRPTPAWGEWGDLFIRGMFVFLISLGYWIIPLFLYWLGKTFWYQGGFAAFIGVLFLIIGVGVGLVAFFLLPMALAFYVEEGEFLAAAFRWKGIVEKIWVVQREYFVGWLAGLIILLALLYLRTQVPYVGWILYALGFFYLSVVMAKLFGRICREGMGHKL